MRHRHADGARPNRGVVHNEAGHEVLIFAGRHPVLQARADHHTAAITAGALGYAESI